MSFKHKIETAISKAGTKLALLSAKLITALDYGDDNKIPNLEHDMKLLTMIKRQLAYYVSYNYTNDLKPYKTEYGKSISGDLIGLCSDGLLNISENSALSSGLNRVYHTYFNESTGKMVVVLYGYKRTNTPSLYLNYLSFYEIDVDTNIIQKVSGNIYTHTSTSAFSPDGIVYSSYSDKYYLFAGGTLVSVDGDYQNALVEISNQSGRSWVSGDVNNEDKKLYLIDSLGYRVDIYNMETKVLETPISVSATPHVCKYVPEYKKLFVCGTHNLDIINTISRAVANLSNDSTKQRLSPKINSEGKVVIIRNETGTNSTYLEVRNPMTGAFISEILLSTTVSSVTATTAGFSIDKNDNIYLYTTNLTNSLTVYNSLGDLQLSKSVITSFWNNTFRTNHNGFNLSNNTLYLPKNTGGSDTLVYAYKFEYDCDDRVSLVPDPCVTLTEEEVCDFIKKIDVISAR